VFGPGAAMRRVSDGVQVPGVPLRAAASSDRPANRPMSRTSGPVIVVLAAIVESDGCLLVTRRPAGTHLEGLWEFPGGKCEPNETHEACLRRELLEELGVESSVGPEVFSTEHAYPDRIVRLHFRECTLHAAPRPMLGQSMRWVARRDLVTLDFPPADRELIDRLTNGR
jgi:mutator protein MutT